MMKKYLIIPGLFALCLLIPGPAAAEEEEDYKILQEIVRSEFQAQTPQTQGGDFNDVIRRFPAKEKKAAIALVACLEQGSDADTALLQALSAKKIPYSIFTDHGWLEKNSALMQKELEGGLASVENHGLFCRPLSVNGHTAGSRAGTANVDEVFEEIEKNARSIEKFSGRLPRFFKAGAGYYDDIALKIVTVLGYTAVEGDLKLRAKDVADEKALQAFLSDLKPGSIIVIPANRPGRSGEWMPKLLTGISRQGYQITALDDVVGLEEETR